MNLLFTIVFGVATKNGLYSSFLGVYNDATCYKTGYDLGQAIQGILSVQVADNVYYSQVKAS